MQYYVFDFSVIQGAVSLLTGPEILTTSFDASDHFVNLLIHRSGQTDPFFDRESITELSRIFRSGFERFSFGGSNWRL